MNVFLWVVTYVSIYLVLSSTHLYPLAAINFYADFQQEIATVESLSVVVAKITKSAKVKDDQFQRSYRVSGAF